MTKHLPTPDGLACPTCGCHHLPVLYTRPAPFKRIRRVRQCRYCGRRITSYEGASGPA